LSRDILHQKAGAGDAVGKGRWSSWPLFEKSAHLLIESPINIKKAFLGALQAGLSCTPLFHDALFHFNSDIIFVNPRRRYDNGSEVRRA